MNNGMNEKFNRLVLLFCGVSLLVPSAIFAESSSPKTVPGQSTAGAVGSSEVLYGPEVHWRAHKKAEDLFKSWNFDQEKIGGLPAGFSVGSTHKESTGEWHIEADREAPSSPHVMTQTASCPQEDCFQVLLADTGNLGLPDIVVKLREVSPGKGNEAGIVLAAQDHRNFYAVTVDLNSYELRTYRVQDGEPSLLGKGVAKPKPGAWHVLRVQVVNSAHVDFPRLELYLDGYEVPMPEVYSIQGKGRIGVLTKGETVAKFDGLGVVEMMANRPLSKPAAY
ncbi:MAG: hypothetical protein OEZ57_01650 [Nitrospirota bacterium]|nr:hypothetical protein [Nitrospirota bacterium]